MKKLLSSTRKEFSSQMEIYLRLLKYVRPYWLAFAAGLIAAVPSGGMDGAIAWLSGAGLQRIFIEGHTRLVYWVPIAVLIVAAVQGIFKFLESYYIRYVGASAIKDLRNELFAHLEKQSLLFFQGQSSGVLIGRLTNDVAIIENAISQAFQSMISRFITLISLVVVLFLQSWQLSLIAISILSLIVFPVSVLSRRIRRSSSGGQQAVGELVSVLSESIQGAKIIQSFNLQRYQTRKFRRTNQMFFSNTMKATRAEAMMSPILAMIGAAGIAAVIWVAGIQVVHHHMTLGSLTSFVIALLLLYTPIKNIGRINGVIQPALAAAVRVFAVLDMQPELEDNYEAAVLAPGPHNIEFKKVYFKYPTSQEMVLRDINLQIPAGQMVALVGLSGAGKTTMANLVPRFYDVQSGEILIDNVSIREYTLKSLRSEIAVVTQDNFLFNATVRQNITMGNIGSTQDEIIAASKAAYCHEFIMQLSQDYDTEIGERGVRLSGGQQQRLSIARAFLKDAPILILDEATSSLDNESEAMVQAALNKLMEGRTVIVIAHRLSTVKHADKILVFDNGSIIESGTHTSLSQQGKVYARLLAAQFERNATLEPVNPVNSADPVDPTAMPPNVYPLDRQKQSL